MSGNMARSFAKADLRRKAKPRGQGPLECGGPMWVCTPKPNFLVSFNRTPSSHLWRTPTQPT